MNLESSACDSRQTPPSTTLLLLLDKTAKEKGDVFSNCTFQTPEAVTVGYPKGKVLPREATEQALPMCI